MATKKELIELVKGAKATGTFPADWFKGYTKMPVPELETLLAATEATSRAVEAVATVVEPAAPTPDLAPEREERPAAVQVAESFVGEFRGNPNRKFNRGTLFRGERAWELWDTHRGHLIAKD